ncbi:MAG: aminotransferase class V-fold PLP-dependent enzyme [Gammaproteobacteria bacterium]
MVLPYFDFAATTPVDPRVADLVLHYMIEDFGNSGSRTHTYGSIARSAVEDARAHVAAVVDADMDEVIFTSGATEANNIAILGLADAARRQNRTHIITTAIEHKAVLEPLEYLATQGFEVTILPVDHDGRVEIASVTSAIRDETFLISVMHVNNETGAIQPIEEIAVELQDRDIWFHVDGAQGFGKSLEGLRNKRIDLISVSGHKIYAPKGVGALITRKRNNRNRPPLTPLMYGGGQERGIRPGTVPVALVAGLGEAARLALSECQDRWTLGKGIESEVLQFIEKAGGKINGNRSNSVPFIVNASFPGLDSEAFIVATKSLIAISNGAACSSHSYERSHVLLAMNLDDQLVGSAIRFSFSHSSTFTNIEELVKTIDSVRF